MPIYLHIWNLILLKEAVAQRYTGGIEQFRLDFEIGLSEITQEDHELFALAQMNSDEFPVETLIDKGLHFDKANQYSSDFTIINRYGVHLWKVNWLEENNVFAWNVLCNTTSIEKAQHISNMPMKEIVDHAENGVVLLRSFC